MMTYQKILNNLPPKGNDDKSNSGDGIIEGNAILNAENQQLSRNVKELKSNLGYAEQELLKKEHEIMNLNNRLLELEARLQRYEYFTGEIDQVEKIDGMLQSLEAEGNRLRKENEELKNSINYYKGHVQTLYLILIIVAIM